MEKIKQTHIFWFIVVLMIIRLFCAGKWMACVGMAGLMIAIGDVLCRFYCENRDVSGDRMRTRYGIVFIFINLLFFITGILLIVNMIADVPCLYDVLLVDEMTLFTLLLTITQNKVIDKLNKFIGK